MGEGGNRESVTNSMDQEDEIRSQMFLTVHSNVQQVRGRFLFTRDGFNFPTYVESRTVTSQFEIVVKSSKELKESFKLLLAIKVMDDLANKSRDSLASKTTLNFSRMQHAKLTNHRSFSNWE